MTSFSIKSDSGVRYEGNEDCVGYDANSRVWLIADGMGGHAAGEVASRIARDTFIARINAGQGHAQAALAAHQQITQSAEAERAHFGMGTTLVAMQIADRHAEFVWVGDSRGYLWRDGQLSVVTHDHSLVQVLIDQGQLTEETARNHPKRNVVTQVLGLNTPEPETRSLPLQTGDWLLLCSDGLNDELTDSEIARVLSTAVDVERVAEFLVARALEHGGRDNVSVVAVEYDGPVAQSDFVGDAKAAGDEADVGSTSGWLEFLHNPVVLVIAAAILVSAIFWTLA